MKKYLMFAMFLAGCSTTGAKRQKTMTIKEDPVLSYFNTKHAKGKSIQDSINEDKRKTHARIIDSLRSLNIKAENEAQVKKLIHQCNPAEFYPSDGDEIDLETVRLELQNFCNQASIYFSNSKLLEQKVKALNAKLYPIYRRQLVKIINNKLWAENGSAQGLGGKCQTIRFVGAEFADHENIQESFKAAKEMLRKYRFKKAEFLWYKDDDEFTYYTITSPNDVDIYAE